MTNNSEDLVNLEDEGRKRALIIMGRDVSQIPCFRDTLMYGISIGVVAGFITFMKTSRPQFSSNLGMASFILTTLGYWFPCRYKYSVEQFEYRKLQALMQKASALEGSALEKEIDEKSENA